MKTLLRPTFHILFLLIFCYSAFPQSGKYISLRQHSEVLENRKKLSNDVDLFFDNSRLTLTKYYHSSPEFIMIINQLGEIKTYYPATNEVSFKQITEMSSKRNLIYYFANNLTDHLGLADEGFTLSSNKYENQFYVTLWKAPVFLKGIENVKMVFENGFPVYSEYQASRNKILKKIYYTSYQDFGTFRLPMKIIEIGNLPSGDSIMNRTLFSNVRISDSGEDKYFNFKIPENAKPINPSQKK